MCTHTDTERKQIKARVQNILKSLKKNTIFNEHPVVHIEHKVHILHIVNIVHIVHIVHIVPIVFIVNIVHIVHTIHRLYLSGSIVQDPILGSRPNWPQLEARVGIKLPKPRNNNYPATYPGPSLGPG